MENFDILVRTIFEFMSGDTDIQSILQRDGLNFSPKLQLSIISPVFEYLKSNKKDLLKQLLEHHSRNDVKRFLISVSISIFLLSYYPNISDKEIACRLDRGLSFVGEIRKILQSGSNVLKNLRRIIIIKERSLIPKIINKYKKIGNWKETSKFFDHSVGEIRYFIKKNIGDKEYKKLVSTYSNKFKKEKFSNSKIKEFIIDYKALHSWKKVGKKHGKSEMTIISRVKDYLGENGYKELIKYSYTNSQFSKKIEISQSTLLLMINQYKIFGSWEKVAERFNNKFTVNTIIRRVKEFIGRKNYKLLIHNHSNSAAPFLKERLSETILNEIIDTYKELGNWNDIAEMFPYKVYVIKDRVKSYLGINEWSRLLNKYSKSVIIQGKLNLTDNTLNTIIDDLYKTGSIERTSLKFGFNNHTLSKKLKSYLGHKKYGKLLSEIRIRPYNREIYIKDFEKGLQENYNVCGRLLLDIYKATSKTLTPYDFASSLNIYSGLSWQILHNFAYNDVMLTNTSVFNRIRDFILNPRYIPNTIERKKLLKRLNKIQQLRQSNYFASSYNYRFHYNSDHLKEISNNNLKAFLNKYFKQIIESNIPEDILYNIERMSPSDFYLKGTKNFPLKTEIIEEFFLNEYMKNVKNKFSLNSMTTKIYDKYLEKHGKRPDHKPILANLLIKNPLVFSIEIPVWKYISNNECLVGFIDLLIYKNNKLYIVDYKPSHSLIMRSLLQLTLYAFILEKKLRKFGVNIEIYCIAFSKDETYQFDPHCIKENFNSFLEYEKSISKRKKELEFKTLYM